jgi:metallo-beta-lactamase family protein
MADILFAGAASEVTGSRHLVQILGKRILLDCGLCQGHRKDAEVKNRNFIFDPAKVDAVILSHAHLDHAGNLPHLVKSGFTGTIWATSATCDLTQVMLEDSGHIQEKDALFFNKKHPDQPITPLYTVEDAVQCQKHFQAIAYEQPFEPVPGVKAVLHEAGHILGSAQVTLLWEEEGMPKSLRFTGDLGRKHIPLLNEPFHGGRANTLITECTYGSRRHEGEGDGPEALRRVLEEAVRVKGKVIIPAFAVGRTQELLYHIEQLRQAGTLPKLPIWVDSPLAKRATEIFERHKADLDEGFKVMDRREDPFTDPMVSFTTSTEESMQLNDLPGPLCIISASGMCEAGRVLHHLRNNLNDKRNQVVIVGYQAEGTLGRRLMEGQRRVKIFGIEHDVSARIVVLHAYSAHADKDDLMEYIEALAPSKPRVILVHGEAASAAAFSAEIHDQLHLSVEVPVLGDTLEI